MFRIILPKKATAKIAMESTKQRIFLEKCFCQVELADSM
jgi:hypothetical protein